MNGKKRKIFVINEPVVPRISPSLAQEIGLNESLILLQIDFWISISTTEPREGKLWTYQSLREMQKNAFPFWSINTINRAIKNLIDKRLLIEGNFNEKKYDKTRWFAIGDGIENLQSIHLDGGDGTRSNQNGTRSSQNGTRLSQNGTTIPDLSTDLSTEQNNDGQPSTPYQKIVDIYHNKCPKLSKIVAISSSRKTTIQARYKQYNYDIEVFVRLFTKAGLSKFLNGQNDRKWKANLDWLLKETNMAKVLEGKYDNENMQFVSMPPSRVAGEETLPSYYREHKPASEKSPKETYMVSEAFKMEDDL